MKQDAVRGRLVPSLLWAVLLSLCWLSVASAHPFDATYYSSRAALSLGEDGLSVLVVVEVPTAFILDEYLELYGDPTQLDEEADEIFRRRQFEKLIGDLRLRINRKVPAGEWRPVESEANGRGTETFFVYMLEYVFEEPGSTLDQDFLDVRVDMEVFSRDFIYLSASAEAESPWTVLENSADPLLETTEEELFDPETGRWTVDPRLRRLRVKFEKSSSVESLSESKEP